MCVPCTVLLVYFVIFFTLRKRKIALGINNSNLSRAYCGQNTLLSAKFMTAPSLFLPAILGLKALTPIDVFFADGIPVDSGCFLAFLPICRCVNQLWLMSSLAIAKTLMMFFSQQESSGKLSAMWPYSKDSFAQRHRDRELHQGRCPSNSPL